MRSILKHFRKGAFSEPAAGRLAALTEEAAPEDDTISEDQAREAEAALGLNIMTRSRVEAQLQMSPGWDARGAFGRPPT